jgi:hypothetical protein
MTLPLDVAREFVRSSTTALELRIEWLSDLSLSSPFSVPRIVEQFVALGERGGFAGAEQHPTESSAHLESQRIADKHGFWLITLANCDPGTSTVLRNVVAFSHANVAPLVQALVRESGPSDERIATPPARHVEPLPFPCEIELESDDVHVCVEFAKRPSDEGRKQVERLLKAWTYVVAAGGFSPRGEDISRPFLIAQEDPDWAVDEVWLRLSDARFEEEAFAPLLNALHYAHRKIGPIARVGVE